MLRERERDRVTSQYIGLILITACVWCVCVRERETGSHHNMSAVLIAACVCVVCERERGETGSHHSMSAVLIAACLQTYMSIITCLSCDCSLLGLN